MLCCSPWLCSVLPFSQAAASLCHFGLTDFRRWRLYLEKPQGCCLPCVSPVLCFVAPYGSSAGLDQLCVFTSPCFGFVLHCSTSPETRRGGSVVGHVQAQPGACEQADKKPDGQVVKGGTETDAQGPSCLWPAANE